MKFLITVFLASLSSAAWTPPKKPNDDQVSQVVSLILSQSFPSCTAIYVCASGSVCPQYPFTGSSTPMEYFSCTDNSCSNFLNSLVKNSFCVVPVLIGKPQAILPILERGTNSNLMKSLWSYIVAEHEEEETWHFLGSDVLRSFPFLYYVTTKSYWNSVHIYKREPYQNNTDVLHVQKDQIRFNRSQWRKVSVDRLSNFRGATIRIAALPFAPYFMDDAETGYDGIDYRIVEASSQALNFKFQFVAPEDRQWGKLINGTWTGMIGMVAYKQAEMAISCITITAERYGYVDFTNECLIDGYNIGSPIPSYLPQWKAIFMPFNTLVWVLVFSTIVVGIVSIWASSVFFKYTRKGTQVAHEDEFFTDLDRCIMFCLKTMCSEPSKLLPTNDGTRMIMAFWFWFILIIISVYSGLLTAFLLDPGREKPIYTVPDILSSPAQPSWGGVSYGGIQEAYFSNSDNQDIQYIWDRMDFKTFQGSFDAVVEGRFVWIELDYTLRMTISQNQNPDHSPKFLLGKVLLFPQKIGFPINQNSPLKEAMDRIIIRLKESGILLKWISEYLGNKEDFVMPVPENDAVLKLRHLQGAFYIMCLGYGTAFLVLIIENAMKSLF